MLFKVCFEVIYDRGLQRNSISRPLKGGIQIMLFKSGVLIGY